MFAATRSIPVDTGASRNGPSSSQQRRKRSEERIYLLALSTSAALINCAAFLYYFFTGQAVLFNDAQSHLNVARSVYDSLTPSIAQLGTIWLPLPHVLELPFIWNDWLWHSGVGGSIGSMVCGYLAVIGMYRLLSLVFNSPFIALLGALILLTNCNLLYLQSTPMTETPLLATFIWTTYWLVDWGSSRRDGSLILAAFCAFLATLSRYEGWAIALGAFVLVLFYCLRSYGPSARTEAYLISFGLLGLVGIVAWLFYNQAITGSYLGFVGRAHVVQTVGANTASSYASNHNVFFSLLAYTGAVIGNCGLFFAILAPLGFALLLRQYWGKPILLFSLLIVSPFFFDSILLYLGQIVISKLIQGLTGTVLIAGWQLPALLFPGAYLVDGTGNARYGLICLPALAFAAAAIARQGNWGRYVVISGLLLQPVMGLYQGIPLTLADAQANATGNLDQSIAGKWLGHHYHGGRILLSFQVNNPFAFQSGLPLKEYVNEGTRDYWERALADPAHNVEWIVLNKPGEKSDSSDTVVTAVAASASLRQEIAQHYSEVYSNSIMYIYQRSSRDTPVPSPSDWHD